MNETFKFARRCNVTGEGMNEGYVVGDGDYYIKYEADAEKWCKEAGYASIEDAYEEEAIYYTEWEELDEDEWFESKFENGLDAY